MTASLEADPRFETAKPNATDLESNARRFGRTFETSGSAGASQAAGRPGWDAPTEEPAVTPAPVRPTSVPQTSGSPSAPDTRLSAADRFDESAQSASDLFNAMVDSQREQAVRSVETVLDQVWRTYGLK